MTRLEAEHMAAPIERRLDLNDERRRKQLRHQGRKAKRIAKDGAR